MAVVKIVQAPDPVLNTKCEEITDFNEETKALAQDLLDTVLEAKDPEGAGLAAPQIGVSKRMCVVRRFLERKDDESASESKNYVLINPVITKFSKEKRLGWEGCLSIPHTWGQVERADKIKVEAFDENGERVRINTSGFFARVIQHEVDHLDGILFTDKNRLVGKAYNDDEFDNLLKEKQQRIAE